MTTAREVVVWKNDWLGPSETFIANQVDALARWTPVPAGLAHSDSLLTGDRAVLTVRRPRLRLAGRSRFAYPLDRSRSLQRALRRADVVHAHFGVDGETVLDSAGRAGTPLVVTFHGYDATTRPDRRRDWRMTRRWSELVDGAVRFVAVSDFVAGVLTDLGAPAAKVVVHHTGIPVPPPVALAASGRAPGILFVGRLVDKKGLDVLLDGLHLLARDHPAVADLPLTVLGDGPVRGGLEEQARRLGVRADFRGMVAPADVDAAMRRASLLVLPSRVSADGDTEGFGMVAIEAGARGLPVVAARAGGTAEAVEDGRSGIVVPPDDPRALAAAIHRVLAEPRLADSLGAGGRARVEERFDIAQQTARLEELYDEVARPD